MAVLPPDPLFTLKANMGYIHSMTYLNFEKDYTRSLLAASESGMVYLWDLESNRITYKQEMGISIQSVHSIDKTLITQEKSGGIKSWVVRESSYEADASTTCYGGYCKSLVFDNYLLVPDEKSKVGILSLDLIQLGSLKPNDDSLGNAMCFEKIVIRENYYILVGYETGDVVLYDLNARKECGRLRLKELVTSISFDEITCRAVVGNSSNDLQLISIDQNLNITLKAEISLTNEGCGVVKIRPDKKILVCGGWDGRLRLFSWKSLRTLVVLTEHKKTITDIQFSPYIVSYWNSNVMAASSGDGTITLWNLYN